MGLIWNEKRVSRSLLKTPVQPLELLPATELALPAQPHTETCHKTATVLYLVPLTSSRPGSRNYCFDRFPRIRWRG
jgi:hypothetical protein